LLLEDKPLRLKRLLQPMQSRNALICTFLALLELVRLQAILLKQERVFGEILIKKHENFEEVLREGSSVRDDWK
jgi:segregation and condensation protein A